MKHIIFGGFDYAVLYEMNQDAILKGIDYFVDIDEELIGTNYLGKPIKPLSELQKENKNNILILIGSIVHRTELEFLLKKMGFQEGENYIWAIAFNGDRECKRLWKHVEWSDKKENESNLKETEEGEYFKERLKVVANMIEWEKIDTVVDLGAANENLRNFVPDNIQYIPVDYVKYTNDTVVLDFNKYEFPVIEKTEKEKACIVAVGVLGYCSDWKWFLKMMKENADYIILGHDDFARVSREYRRTHWTRYNALFDHEIIRYMQNLGFMLTESVDFRLKTSLFKFEKMN